MNILAGRFPGNGGTITSSEFELRYAEQSGVSVEELRSFGRVVVRCKCSEPICLGWASVPKDIAEHYINAMNGGPHGYRYPREGE